MRILIADDEAPVRSALRLRLEHEPGLKVVGEADGVPGLLAQVRAALPDMVLLDWRLPGLAAGEVVPALRALRPGLLIVGLDGPTDKSATTARLADTVVSKLDPPERLLAALGNCGPRMCVR